MDSLDNLDCLVHQGPLVSRASLGSLAALEHLDYQDKLGHLDPLDNLGNLEHKVMYQSNLISTHPSFLTEDVITSNMSIY